MRAFLDQHTISAYFEVLSGDNVIVIGMAATGLVSELRGKAIAVASNFVAKLLHRFRWIGWIGLVVIVYVALDMVWSGGGQLLALYGHTA
ncbi:MULTISPECIES: hypothetical protein [unclassified Rhizobium]|uniref:hypothetical protein n=1 Tax=unclassified Rhizobium TaxID=2613769 RepID=UPI0021F73AF5|nr:MULTISPECIES: hypothetical protein [unclassified Rhizobium]MCV9946666.1 hypothetical protein [Rhizobium sp. BT-175]MCW0020521.1 hypothetical protein [Rhizobium sp. BT-226]